MSVGGSERCGGVDDALSHLRGAEQAALCGDERGLRRWVAETEASLAAARAARRAAVAATAAAVAAERAALQVSELVSE